MRHRPLFWKIFPSTVLVALVVLVAVGWSALRAFNLFTREHLCDILRDRISLVDQFFIDALTGPDPAAADALAKALGAEGRTRFTVVAADGRVLGDTLEDPPRMDNHGARPEIIEALQDGWGEASRYSATLDETLIYTARRLDLPGGSRVVLRAAIPLTRIEREQGALRLRLLTAGALVALLAAALSWWQGKRLARPLIELRTAIDQYSRGELDVRLPITRTEEVAGLAEAMKQMAFQLHDRIQRESGQRNEQQAVLSSMAEGVLAIDTQERILNINRAASTLLGIEGEAAGRPIQEVLRNIELLQFIQRALDCVGPIEAEIVLLGESRRHLRVIGTPLRDAAAKTIGAVAVMHDMTRLRHLENLRREFVANVSHELRTPITSIKGFAETMLEDEGRNPEQSRRFLEIIARQADRLNNIIEDLLALARIEQDADDKEILRARGQVREVLLGALQICSQQSDEKRIHLVMDAPEGLDAEINAPLVEQAIVNLVDNAIKYSEPETTVRVSAAAEGNKLLIRVQDEGCGIESDHLPRLFERFYRVDKARSRKLGGTGLGLAIVKHIAEAHKGTIEVQSTPGRGSLFTLSLPRG